MCIFQIDYYYQNNQSGNLDTSKVRRAAVYANNIIEAVKKVKDIDGNYIKIAFSSAKEIKEKNEDR